MTRITVAELRENLEQILERVQDGEEIVVTYRGGSPVRLVPEQSPQLEMKGLDALLAFVPASEAVPDDVTSFEDQYAEHLEAKYGKYTR